jgi:hypothetical protein
MTQASFHQAGLITPGRSNNTVNTKIKRDREHDYDHIGYDHDSRNLDHRQQRLRGGTDERETG